MTDTLPPVILALRDYHARRVQRAVRVTSEKCPLPMVWFDTSILVDIAKAKCGERIDPHRASILIELYEQTRCLVREGKVICPKWDQSLEFEGKRLEDGIFQVVESLALGSRCIPYQGAKDAQIMLSTEAYCVESNTFHIPWRSYFPSDPRTRIADTIARNYFLVDGLRKPMAWIEKAGKNSDSLQASWEALRQDFNAEGRTYEEQVEREKKGEASTMVEMMLAFHKRQRDGSVDMWDELGVHGLRL